MKVLDGLDGWIEVAYECKNNTVVINAKYSVGSDKCLKCGSQNFLKHGPKAISYKDQPYKGKNVIINAKLQRYKCGACLSTFIQSVQGIYPGTRLTERCVQFIQANYMNETYTSLAKKIGVDDKTVRNIVNAYVDGG